MNKAKKRILGYLSYWVAALGLQNWELAVIWRTEGGCEVQANIPYKSAKILFDLTIAEEEWEGYVLHELLHILVSEYRQWLHLVKDRVTKQETDLFCNIEEGVVNSLMMMTLQGRLVPHKEEE